jgi:hypothetical protein
MKKFMYFMEETDGEFDTLNDAFCPAVERFKGFRSTGTTTTLIMDFEPVLSVADSDDAAVVGDSVLLTITENKQKEVMQSIIQLINSGPHSDGFLVISDDSNSVFADSRITGCAVTVTAEA